MEHRALFRNSAIVFLLVSFSCHQPGVQDEVNHSTIRLDKNDLRLRVENGLLLWDNSPFSGTLYSLDQNNVDTLSLSSYRSGWEHGEWKQFYEGGQLKERRFFNNGLKACEYVAWWPNGKKQLHYIFENGEYESTCREWNNEGTLIKLANYKKGYEEGLQQLWYDNGKVRANYVIKDGRRYGLLGTKNCINVSDSVFRK